MKTRIMLLMLLFMSSKALKAQTIMNIYQNNGTVVQIPVNSIDSITYSVLNIGNLATLTTLPITNLTSNTASSGGNITNDGGTPITQRGVVWSTSPNPTTADSFTIEGNGTGSFSSEVTGLSENITYYLRAYATNSDGTAYGNELSFNLIISNPGTGVTFDGYTYSSIVLGNGQEWMAENLRTTIYANGDPIPNIADSNQWYNLTTDAWCHYNNDSQYEYPYGKLYNWNAVNDSRNVCPIGWHVPTYAEWCFFINYLDPTANGGNNTVGGSNENTAGGKMKSIGTQHWLYPNTGATNESGFSGLPGGGRYHEGQFSTMGNAGHWWSSSEVSSYLASTCALVYDVSDVFNADFDVRLGLSVRCLKD